MIVRGKLTLPLLVAAAAAVVAGCGEGPAARFVSSDRTKKLAPHAKAAVEGEMKRDFGEPNHMVAWRKLPVDFGEFDGVVEKPAENLSGPLEVRLTAKPQSVVSLKPDRFKGAALVWLSGENTGDLAARSANGKEEPINFEVAHYDPESSRLRIRVLPPAKLKAQKGDKFAILGPVLQHGRKLYLHNCEHCHGVSGDGDGPTAKYFDIKPRDYRLGLFKFTSTRNPDKIRRDDLARTIRLGIPGTYMPSFLLFTDEEVGSLVEYVRWLSMRGEFEQKVDVEFEAEQYTTEAIRQRRDGGEPQDQIDKALAKFTAEDLPRIAGEKGEALATAWTGAEKPESLVVPKTGRTPISPESLERGRKLYYYATAKCAQCHGPAGRGDGPQTEDYQQIPGSTKKRSLPGLFDDWGHPIKPRDLTSGVYRGGRRPLDIYRRIYSGIKGTPMPPFGSALKEDEIWDLVNYAMNLPFKKGSESPERPQQPKVASVAAATVSTDRGATAGAGGN